MLRILLFHGCVHDCEWGLMLNLANKTFMFRVHEEKCIIGWWSVVSLMSLAI